MHLGCPVLPFKAQDPVVVMIRFCLLLLGDLGKWGPCLSLSLTLEPSTTSHIVYVQYKLRDRGCNGHSESLKYQQDFDTFVVDKATLNYY